MFRIIAKSLATGVVTGRHPEADHALEPVSPEAIEKAKPFRRSLTIRAVDTGSCNACEMELNALINPIYDVERFGVHIAASPRHADALVVTGPVTVNMERPLKEVYKATPDPKLVIALGDCALTCGVFKGSYAVTGPVDRHLPVDVRIPGCPPKPAEILAALSDLRGENLPPHQ
ncbi:NADH-quinone oxidoreductase subunit NuoB [Nitrospirales bacterium NOB]|nr:MAG: putative formate hydrogenlyase small subunit [Nitrospira sp. OLB3]MBV6468370.1 NAD(P)H-quinone oxidoreductase subunit K, chloroplastic [Nitrospirota bacterium]MCE7963884.1 NADH-quinone oxidoreductase subunit NuoB [Nitrospira sp. NTP2]MCK6494286.1 NADH-quinone oxidoreductase subunit B family protein [Nitrospira sp.]MDL1890851.1 NADH-quinone oxidoreductase subunit NuoB [Nitrospirales bacterium NOB]MEB2339264.1 NADH-quinone oxidoreductase subunit B family protein [Nitrospirales bacterium]